MAIDPDRVQEVFLAAVEAADPNLRTAILDRECGPDTTLRHRVEALLRAHDEPGSLLGGMPSRTPLPEWPDAAPTGADVAGVVVAGRYTLVRPLGEGGMGVVFLAEQTEPVRRFVAVKVVKAGMGSAAVLGRFEAERQALALMDHPGIARVFDAGTTAEGLPFFALELVDGVPITRYCDEHRLPVRQRLELFGAVCRAVQHAHQKGVIHRDLKPSNILVAVVDGRPVPKVIDFGVAKAVGGRLTESTVVTGFGMVLGTPEYMSPEQAELDAVDVDTRSDIYSLGVLLYELLTGTTPLGRTAGQTPVLELLRAVREEEAVRPSVRLGEVVGLGAVAAARGVEPARLLSLVRGDLDWIAVKALEKDRSRRYETAESLAADVERYLRDEPVTASPPSVGYLARKFYRRNRGPLLAAGAIAAVLFLAVVGTTWGLVRSEMAHQRTAEALVQVTDEQERTQAALETTRTARYRTHVALLALTDEVVERSLTSRPVGKEEKAFLSAILDLWKESIQGWDESKEGRYSLAIGHGRLGGIYHRLGQSEQAEEEYRHALSLLKRLVADDPGHEDYRQDLAMVQSNYGSFLRELQRWEDAEAELQAALDNCKQLVRVNRSRKNREVQAHVHNNLAIVFQFTKRQSEAEAEWAAAKALYEELVAEDGADETLRCHLARTRGNLAHSMLLANLSRVRQAETEFTLARELLLPIVAGSPTNRQAREDLAMIRTNLGTLYLRLSLGNTAESEWTAARDLYRGLTNAFPAVPDYANGFAGASVNLAILRLQQKRRDEARQLLEEAVPYHKSALTASPATALYHEYYRNNRLNMAKVMITTGELVSVPRVAAEMIEHSPDPRADEVLAASFLSLCAELTGKDPRVAPELRTELADFYARLAVESLERARLRGFRGLGQVQNNSFFDALRGREDYRDWVARMEQAAEPSPGPGLTGK